MRRLYTSKGKPIDRRSQRGIEHKTTQVNYKGEVKEIEKRVKDVEEKVK